MLKHNYNIDMGRQTNSISAPVLRYWRSGLTKNKKTKQGVASLIKNLLLGGRSVLLKTCSLRQHRHSVDEVVVGNDHSHLHVGWRHGNRAWGAEGWYYSWLLVSMKGTLNRRFKWSSDRVVLPSFAL